MSVGLETSESGKQLAKTLGIELDKYNFASDRKLCPGPGQQGSRASTCRRLPGSQGHSAVRGRGLLRRRQGACSLLSEAKGSLAKTKTYPGRGQDVTGKEPRIGVFVCSCGINIAGVVDVKDVVEYAKGPCPMWSLSKTTCSPARRTPRSHRGEDQGEQPEPGGRGLYAQNPRAPVPETLKEAGTERVPLRNGQHPQPEQLGASERAGKGHQPRPRTRSAWPWPKPGCSTRWKTLDPGQSEGSGRRRRRGRHECRGPGLADQGFETVLIEKSSAWAATP
jgi:hypothetical protein